MMTPTRSQSPLLDRVMLGDVAAPRPLPPPRRIRRAGRSRRNAETDHRLHPLHEIDDALIRLPLAARSAPRWRCGRSARARRRGTPAVVQTQIILAVVGAVIMLVVGASLARAFGIVGAANLIRYRSKIDDPKDAVVMLCALAVGLASGVGLYALARFATAFMGAALWVIESFEPKTQAFDLKIKAGKRPTSCAEDRAGILRRYQCEFELRTSSDEEVCYEVQVPLDVQTDRVSNAILRSRSRGHAAVEWAEKKEEDNQKP